jgi:cation transport ATPase
MIDSRNICVGDLLVLSLGVLTLVDGVVLAGEVTVDESCMFGNSEFVRKQRGDKVISGSTIMSGGYVINRKRKN